MFTRKNLNASPKSRVGSKKWWPQVLTFFISGLICVIAVVAFKYWLSFPPSDVAKADAGFQKAKQTVDPEKLRAWALSEIANGQHEIPEAKIPNYIKTLYPEPLEYALIEKDASGEYVDLTWGGGFFHWGFSIGSTHLTLPAGTQNTWTISEWVPGIYYGREDTAHKIQ